MPPMTQKYMTPEDCERKHGTWGKVVDYLMPIIAIIAIAAFGFAFDSNREVGEVKTKAEGTEKRVDRLESKIDNGFQQVLDRLDRK
jgi:hypothetical protein